MKKSFLTIAHMLKPVIVAAHGAGLVTRMIDYNVNNSIALLTIGSSVSSGRPESSSIMPR